MRLVTICEGINDIGEAIYVYKGDAKDNFKNV
jgi:hypothetical protein